jgi:hypothetical protein
VINGVLAQVPSHSRANGSLKPFSDYFPSSGRQSCESHSQQNSILAVQLKVKKKRKAKWKQLELPKPRETEQKQYCIPEGGFRNQATIKCLKGTMVVIPTTSPSNSPI